MRNFIFFRHKHCWLLALAAIVYLSIGKLALTQEAELAGSDWRKELGVFRIGIVSVGSTESARLHAEPFRLALAEALGVEAEIYPVRDGINLINALTSARIEYAILPTTAYAAAWSLCECVEPLVVPRSADSSTGYHAILISRPDGPASMSEIGTGPIGLLGQQSSVLTHGLLAQALREAGTELYGGQIETVSKSDSELTVSAFERGEFPLLLGWSSLNGDPTTGYDRGTLNTVARLSDGQSIDYRILWKSPLIPHHPHAVRKNIDGEAKRILRQLLASMFEDDPVAYDSIEHEYGGGFSAARQGMFTPFVELMRSGLMEELAASEKDLPTN